MPLQPVFLWTDILIFILLAAITAGILYLCSKPHLRAPWIMVMQRKRGVISLIILLSYISIGLLDSLHFRTALASEANKKQHYSTEVFSVFDWLVTPIRTQVEKNLFRSICYSLICQRDASRFERTTRVQLSSTRLFGAPFAI